MITPETQRRTETKAEKTARLALRETLMETHRAMAKPAADWDMVQAQLQGALEYLRDMRLHKFPLPVAITSKSTEEP